MNKEKFSPVDKLCKKFGDYLSIVGIGIEETERLKRLHNRPNQISLLEQYGYTTAMAKELCQKYGLLSPYYEIGRGRQGCWFCPNQSILEMAKFKKDYPYLWSELEQMNKYYLEHKNDFCRDYFRFNKTFDEVMSQINTINNQVSIFELLGE